jgi:hypothetical protein
MLHFIFICGTLYYLNTTYNIKFYRYNSNVKKSLKYIKIRIYLINIKRKASLLY